jgi:hypothetical protein
MVHLLALSQLIGGVMYANLVNSSLLINHHPHYSLGLFSGGWQRVV